MNIADRLRRGLSGQRRAPAQQARRRRPAPARPVPGSIERRDTMTFASLDAVRAADRDGLEQLVAEYVVPRRQALRIRDAAMRMYLRARVSADLTNDSNTSEQVDVGALGLVLVRSTRSAPSLPTQAHPDVSAEVSTDSGQSWSAANVTAVDFAAGTVTVAKPADTDVSVRIYGLQGAGQVRIGVRAPAGSGSVEQLVWNSTLRAVHEADQAESTSAPNIVRSFGGGLFLTPQFALGVYVTPQAVSGNVAPIEWAAGWGHELAIPFARRPIDVRDKAATVEATLRRLKF